MFSMILLKATECNWDLLGPGSWNKRSWKINEDGWYQYKESYVSVRSVNMPDIPDAVEEGVFSVEQMKRLKAALAQDWPGTKLDGCDGAAWEFKLYADGIISKHRELGYIGDIEPYKSIEAVLTEET